MDSSKMIASKDEDDFAKVVFMGGDKQHSYETNGRNVIVVGSAGTHDHGSSKIKLKNIVDYKWEVKHYNGHLIATHIDGKYLAYAIKVNGKDGKGKAEGMVRVVNPVTGQRALIRGKSSEVLDLQFAHMKTQILLASIEDIALHIHKIETVKDSIICTLLLKIEDAVPDHVPKYDQINWCPYVPADETESDSYVGRLIVWTRGTSYQCYSVNAVVENYGIGSHRAADIKEGALRHQESSFVTGATLSPDGTTIAITFEDGGIRFYQVYFHINEDTPRLLHQWIPHGGKPVTGLFFLDDYSKYNADNSLWKHAITTSNNNTEIKVWCCATWQCIQTIVFNAANESELFFKAEIDPTSSYLVLTDTKNRGLYVLEVIQTNDEPNDDSKSTDEENANNLTLTKPTAFIKSITEFPLSSPILSFGILNATVRKYKSAYNDIYSLEDVDDYDEDSLNRYCVVIHLFLVQPKSVQECQVLYQPSLTASIAPVPSIESSNGAEAIEAIKEADPLISSLSVGNVSNLLDSSLKSTRSGSTAELKTSPALIKSESNLSQQSTHSGSAKPLNLMTPDSFHSSGKMTPEGVSNEVYSALRMLAGEKPIDGSPHLLHLVNNNKKIDETEHKSPTILPPMPPTSMLAAAGVSGGSSPSREVQEILSLKDSECMNDFYTNSLDIQDDTDGSGNNADGADTNDAGADADAEDDEKNSNQDDDDTYTLSNVNDVNGLPKAKKSDWPIAPDVTAMPKLNKSGHTYKQPAAASMSPSPINSISHKLDQMLEIIQTQNCQISELRNEIIGLKQNRTERDDSLKVEANKIEIRLSKLIEEYLIRYEREHNKKLDAFITGRDTQNREIREGIVHGLSQMICTQINVSLNQIVSAEMKKHVLPIIASKMDATKAQIQADIAQKISISDHVIKENILNICKSRETLEVFGSSVAAGVKSGMQHTYADSLKSIILPAYEKANAELFKQLYDTFNKGTIAYSNQMATYTKMYEPIHNELLNFIRSVPEKLQALNDATVSTCTQKVNGEINKDLKVMQINLLKTLKENIKSEIKKGFESQAASLEDTILAVRSQAQTPAPSIFDVQEQIKHLLHQGQINKAFHQALLANDLHLVEYALERADYNQVFNPCPLEQTVLLSLIQQISADMSNHTELKQKYLSDAIINLNLRDSITKEHSPKVLKELLLNCQNYVMANTASSLSSSVRMLMMAVQGFGINLI